MAGSKKHSLRAGEYDNRLSGSRRRRSSGRETLGRVAAGAIAAEFLKTLGIKLCAYTKTIGSVCCQTDDYHTLLLAEGHVILRMS